VAFALGLIALRIRGLYLALITLAFGLAAQGTIFNWRQFTGGGAGAPAPRPAGFESNQAYAYLCLLFLGFFLLVDWRLAKSKAGRAIVSVRGDERVAATLGVNVTGSKLLAFVVSGFIAGVAGALFAHQTRFVYANNFDFTTALVWVIMAVVGGLGSRAGVVIASAFFALFPFLLQTVVHVFDKTASDVTLASYTPLLGAVLLLLTLTRYPGGVAEQLLPIRRWLAGGVFRARAHPAVPSPAAPPVEEPPAQPVDDRPSAAMPVPPMPAPATRRGLRTFRRRRRE